MEKQFYTFLAMDKVKNHMVERIETTIGDLICAICDAAQEVTLNADHVNELSHAVLMDILQQSEMRRAACQ